MSKGSLSDSERRSVTSPKFARVPFLHPRRYDRGPPSRSGPGRGYMEVRQGEPVPTVPVTVTARNHDPGNVSPRLPILSYS